MLYLLYMEVPKLMKTLKVLIPVALVLALAACAKPPQADIDAARAALAAAEKNADIVAYAPDSLKSAQASLAQMETELTAKHYDKVKTLALEAKAMAGTAAYSTFMAGNCALSPDRSVSRFGARRPVSAPRRIASYEA